MQSLSRKMALRATSETAAKALQASRALARTGQVARSTIELADGDVFLDEMLSSAADTTATVEGHESELEGSREVADEVVDVLPDMTEDSWEAEDVGQTAADGADWAAEIAAEAGEQAQAAQVDARSAAATAASALTTADGKNSRRQGTDIPAPPEGGWVQGDQWAREEIRDGTPVVVEILVWNGDGFVPDQILANDVLSVGPNGVVRLKDGTVTAEALLAESVTASALAADALTAKRIESPEIVGGVIEAPTIVSSASIGVLANELADPNFESPFDTSWVLSGFLGDTQVQQVDTVTWDQSWTWNTGTVTSTFRNWGAFTATFQVQPRARRTAGTIIRPNFSWLDKSPRSISNPHKFTNLAGSKFDEDHLGGHFDPTFKKVDTRAPLPGTARTTYLTNSNTFVIEAGTRWRYKLQTTRLTAAQAAFVSAFQLQLIDAATGSVVFQHSITKAEMQSGNIVGYWDNKAFTGPVKYRVLVTYTAGAGQDTATRKLNAAARAQQTRNGSPSDPQMLPNSGFVDLPYTSYPKKTNGVMYANGKHTTQYVDRLTTAIDLLHASFQNVETRSGWRITEDNGLETFNASGFVSGRFDGEDNFFSGRMASKESGTRWEIEGGRMSLFGPTGLIVAQMRDNNGALLLDGPVSFLGDTDWTDIRIRPGFSAQSPNEQPQVMRSGGKLYLRGLFSNTGIVANGTPTVADMPDGFAPPRNMQVPAGTSSGAATAQMFLSASGTIQIRAGSTLSAYYGFGASVWPGQS